MSRLRSWNPLRSLLPLRGAPQAAARSADRPRRRRLALELLEDRRVFAAVPSVTLTAPATAMIGESVQLTATFDNLSATDTGFGPFIDLYLPFNGADGVNGVGADGLSFVSATYLGASLGTSVLTFPDLGGGIGTVEHPFAVNSAGDPLLVTGNAGDQLVVIIQPFGSFAPDQPAANVLINLDLSDFADLGAPLDLYARAGFRFGNDPLDNPDVDPSLVSQASPVAMDWSPSASIEPILMELTKNYLGPEDETATGPNFPRQYEIVVDIADGQTITDLDIADFLPPNIVVTGVDTISPAGVVTTPLTFPLPPANPPNNQLNVNIPTVTGTTSGSDARIVFSFYVPFRDADGNLVIDAVTGDDTVSNNNVTAIGDWDPLDPRDPAGTNNAVADPTGFEHVLIPKSIAIQKSVEPVLSPGSEMFMPGSVVEYTIVGQISDYFGFDNLVMNDVLSDGQRFDTSFTPLLTWNGHLGDLSAAGINAANYEIIDRFTGGAPPVAPIDGTQEVVFRISDELELRRGTRLGIGGLVPSGGTGGPDPNESTFDEGPTTFTITFRAIIQQAFTDNFPSGNPAVDEGDVLGNQVDITGDVLSYVNLTPTGEIETDDSSAGFSIVISTLTKSIYAINGSTTFDPNFLITAGDTITYRIRHTMPITRFEDLVLTDYLPLPVLLASEVTVFDAIANATPPVAGRAQYGPDDTFLSDHSLLPILTTDPVSNAVVFSYPLYTSEPGIPSVQDILFTVTVQPTPYADELFLTNQVRAVQNTTNTDPTIEDAIIQIQTGQPSLNIKKGVVATDNVDGIFSPTIVGPVPFNAPGTVGDRFAGTISSDGLLLNPIDSNLSNVDGGDLVTFAIVIENTGNSRRGAFDILIRDTLPTGFVIPSGGAGLNLRVTDGTGGLVSYVDIDGGLFDEIGPGGIQLTDPGPTLEQPDGTAGGAADAYDPTSGRNVLIVTYDLQVDTAVEASELLVNTASIENYASQEGGPNFVLSLPVEPDDAEVGITSPIVASKQLVATNQAHTAGLDVAIGEIVTYTTTITIPEGTTSTLLFTDLPDNGLAIGRVVSIAASAGLTSNLGPIAGLTPVIGTQGQSVTINFGTVTNSDVVNTTAETIVITYEAVVVNSAGNNRGTDLDNLASVTWENGTDSLRADAVEVVEPTLRVTKTLTPPTGQANDVFTIQLIVTHTPASDTDAFNVSLSDVLPNGLTFVSGTLSSSGTAVTTLTELSDTITATWDAFPLGSSTTITFQVRAEQSVQPGDTITNTANVNWTSLPGNVSAAQFPTITLSNERSGNTAHPGGTVNDYRANGSDTLDLIDPTLTKSILSTSLASTSGNDVAIGEVITYTSVITVPQGTLTNSVWTDTVSPGLAIVDVLSIVANPSADISPSDFAPIIAAATFDANRQTVSLDFDTIVNSNLDNATTETITITYRAVVLNSITNDRGDDLDNTAEFTWGTNYSIDAAGPTLEIVEPELTISKTIVPASGQAGDIFNVTLIVSHSGLSDADAYDVVLSDILPDGLTYFGALGSLGTVPTTLAESSDTITASWAAFPLGSSTTITFQVQAELLAEPSDTITNIATTTWTSLPGDVSAAQFPGIPLSNERGGEPTDPGGAANDYLTEDEATLDLNPPVLTKSILSTSLASTLGNDVAIGEVITYTTVITIPQGTLTNSVWTDTVSAGLAIVDVLSIVANPSGDISPSDFAPIIAAATFDANRQTVSLDFGTIVNSNLNSATTETITITYRAVVLNSAANDRGDDLDNTAEFTWGTNFSVDAAGPTLEIVEPELSVNKSIVPASGQAADIFTVTLVVTHTGLSDADAYDVSLSDILPDGLTYVGGLSAIGTAPTSLTEVNDTITANWAAFPLGSSTSITFQVQTELSIQPGDTISNVAVADWTSLPGDFPQDVIDALPPNFPDLGERTGDDVGPNDYNADGTGTLDVIALELAKTIQGTDQPQTMGLDVAIGEVITYRSTITVPQGTAPGVVWIDTPVAGLSLIEVVSITTPRPGLSSSLGSFSDILNAQSIAAGGTFATLNFGTLTNNDTDSALDETIVIEYTAIVLNTPTNDRGDQLGNAARLTYNSFQVAVDGPLVTIVEPELTIAKSNNEVPPIDAGDIFTFTIDIAHSGNSDAAAMDVALQDLINSAPNFLGYVSGTLNVTVAGGTVLGSVSDALGDLNVVFDTIPLGGTAQITFDVIIQNTAPPETELVNNATLTWTSVGGPRDIALSDNPLSVERTGNPADVGGAANDYNTAASDSVITAAAEPTKFISSTSQDHTESSQHSPGITDLAIGEFVTFDIRVRLPEGTQPLNVIDNLPLAPPLRLVSWSIPFIGDNLQVTAANFTATPADTNSDGILDEIEWNAAAFLNLPDGVADTDDDIVFRVVAELLDTPGATDGTVLTNTATINLGGPTSQVVTADVEVVEPIVELTKTVSPTTAPAGSTLTYTVVISHDLGSTSDAFDLLIEDLLSDPDLVLVPGSVTTTAGTIQEGNQPTDTTIVIAIGSLPLGDTITVTFDAIMNSALLLGEQVTNTSSVTYDGLEGPGGREETSSDDVVVTADDPLVDLSVVKSDSPDPVVINDILTYTLIVTNDGPSDATDVILTDVLPAAVTLIDVSPSAGVTVIGQTLTIPLGRLEPGESREITIRVTAPPTEQFLINTASVTTPETDSDPDNNQTTEETEVLGVSNVSGTVWVDINKDGVIGPTEVRLPGVLITLQGTDVNGNPILLTTTTDANGFYQFLRVPPGEYSLIQTQPTLFVDGSSYVGSEGGTNPTSNRIDLTLPAGVDATDYLFSELGLKSSSISKRSLIKSRVVAAPAPFGLTFDRFYDLLGRSRTRADLDGNGRVDNADYALFLTRLGGTF